MKKLHENAGELLEQLFAAEVFELCQNISVMRRYIEDTSSCRLLVRPLDLTE